MSATECPDRLYIGGLLRCCIASLNEHAETCGGEHNDGDAVECRYCSTGGVVLRDGAWRWPGPTPEGRNE